jgi:phospholipase D1/2
MARIIFVAFGRRSRACSTRCFILAADIDSCMKLTPDGSDDGCADALGDFLHDVAASRKRLCIYILLWDFVALYSFCKMGWRTQRRVAFQMDGKHPMGNHITRRGW